MLQASDTVFIAGERVHVKERHDGRERRRCVKEMGGGICTMKSGWCTGEDGHICTSVE